MVIIGKPLTFRYYPYPDTTPYITRMPHLHYTVRKTGIGHRTETLSININVHLNHLAYPPGHVVVVFFFVFFFPPPMYFCLNLFPYPPFFLFAEVYSSSNEDGGDGRWASIVLV